MARGVDAAGVPSSVKLLSSTSEFRRPAAIKSDAARRPAPDGPIQQYDA